METIKTFQDAALVYTYRTGPVQITEWTHESGVANVAVLPEGGGLLYQPNRLLLSKMTASGRHQSSLPSAEELLTQLRGCCADVDTLKRLWS